MNTIQTQNKLRGLMKKVPEATVLFWITKILTTGMGETASDYFVAYINPFIAIGIAGIVLIAVLVLQLSTRRYVAWIYWLTVVMISIFGTMAADAAHVGLGIPYVISALFFAVILAIIFIVWYASENTLSVHSITTLRRELFYWATVLATFALGTALGDMTATTLHLGYFPSGLLFTGLIILPAIGFWFFDLNEVAAFWFAYILTRPLGASFSDWAAVSHIRGGLGLGTGPISLVLGILIICLVGYLSMGRRNAVSVK